MKLGHQPAACFRLASRHGLGGEVGDARPLPVRAVALAVEREVEHIFRMGGGAGVIGVQRACLCVVCSFLLSLGCEGEVPPGD
jgi:hypothetical protein